MPDPAGPVTLGGFVAGFAVGALGSIAGHWFREYYQRRDRIDLAMMLEFELRPIGTDLCFDREHVGRFIERAEKVGFKARYGPFYSLPPENHAIYDASIAKLSVFPPRVAAALVHTYTLAPEVRDQAEALRGDKFSGDHYLPALRRYRNNLRALKWHGRATERLLPWRRRLLRGLADRALGLKAQPVTSLGKVASR